MHNFIGYQMKYDTDYYIFQSYNRIKMSYPYVVLLVKMSLLIAHYFMKKGQLDIEMMAPHLLAKHLYMK